MPSAPSEGWARARGRLDSILAPCPLAPMLPRAPRASPALLGKPARALPRPQSPPAVLLQQAAPALRACAGRHRAARRRRPPLEVAHVRHPWPPWLTGPPVRALEAPDPPPARRARGAPRRALLAAEYYSKKYFELINTSVLRILQCMARQADARQPLRSGCLGVRSEYAVGVRACCCVARACAARPWTAWPVGRHSAEVVPRRLSWPR